MLEYPFLSAVVMLGWVVPQLVGVSVGRMASPESIAAVSVFSALCLGSGSVAYYKNRRAAKLASWDLDPKKFRVSAAILSILGVYFFFQVSALEEQANIEYGGAWSGVITIYVFLSNMLTIGLAMALVSYSRRPTIVAAIVIACDLLLYGDRIFIHGRRSELIELFLMLALAMWFGRRWAPPRSLVFLGMFAGLLVVGSIGEYRSLMLTGDGSSEWSGAGLSAVLKIDFIGNLVSSVTDPGPYDNQELANAANTVDAVTRSLSFDFGLSLWNAFVHSYVPAQIVGPELKGAMTITLEDVAFNELRYQRHTGTTLTGMADAFRSFWYFGAVKFALIGYIMSRWYRAAVRGSPTAQVVVMVVTPLSLLAVTHTTHHFFLGFITLAMFLWPALYLSQPIGNRRQRERL